jgi:RNA polymerase sigma factor (TIGR02999 family)
VPRGSRRDASTNSSPTGGRRGGPRRRCEGTGTAGATAPLFRSRFAPGRRILNDMADVTRLLDAAAAGDPKAAAELLPLVYDELRKLAAARMAAEPAGHTLQPTALVHEAYLRLVGDDPSQPWHGRGHFFAAAAEAMRRILIESARRKKAGKHGAGRRRIPIDDVDVAAPGRSDDLLALDEALAALERADRQAAALVKLRSFAGLTVREAAAALGIAPRTADASGPTPGAGCSTGCRGRPPAPPKNPDLFLRDCDPDFALFGEGRRGRARPMTEREIFVAAYQRPDPAERRRYLDGACGHDPDLLRRVENLLGLAERAGSFLERPAAGPTETGETGPATGPPADPTAGSAPTPAAGAVLAGQYQLLELIGEGGMGAVWLAQQHEPVKRLVAVKLIGSSATPNSFPPGCRDRPCSRPSPRSRRFVVLPAMTCSPCCGSCVGRSLPPRPAPIRSVDHPPRSPSRRSP